MAIVIEDPIEYRNYSLNQREKGFKIGFVPTMGALHDGHLELVKKARNENDVCLTSIFTNPTQFDDQNDFKSYPSHFNEDLKKLESLNVDCVFTPSPEAMYPKDFTYKIRETELSNKLCGQYREGHFEGVLSIVLKLLNLSHAHKAYFGEKDYQQFLLIKGMAEAFFIETEIIPVRTVREESGLAMSSRNELLSYEGKTVASDFYRLMSESVEKGSSPKDLERKLLESGFEVQYIEDFMERRFAAVYREGVRLIDNISL